MVVQHNLTAMNANRMLGLTSKSQSKTTEKLSSGYKINRAADDAAGLSISEKLRRQIRGLNQGAENIEEGTSLCQVADGALAEVDDLLQRANELAVKAANGTNTSTDRSYIQQEVNAIVSEINRIGRETTFNEIHIFDKETIEGQVGKITQLVSSPSGDKGYLSEAYYYNGKYYSSASMDFSAVNSSNVQKLNNASFNFTCSAGCSEAFRMTFKTDGTPSGSDTATTKDRSTTHNYVIDISNCRSGSDVVNAVYDYVKSDPARSNAETSAIGGLLVSHSNILKKSDDGNSLMVIGTSAYGTSTDAENAQKGRSPYGVVNCSDLTQIMVPEPIYTIPIQCSSDVYDKEYVHTRWMNGEALGIDPLDVSSSQEAAGTAIDKIKGGMEYIASMRSGIGAEQNRLEHSYNNNLNISENTTAAESQIRDTDMAEMMVKFSNENILSQAGQTMLAQANQSNEMVLSLLQ